MALGSNQVASRASKIDVNLRFHSLYILSLKLSDKLRSGFATSSVTRPVQPASDVLKLVGRVMAMRQLPPHLILPILRILFPDLWPQWSQEVQGRSVALASTFTTPAKG